MENPSAVLNSSITENQFPALHAYLISLPAMNAHVSAALNSLEASMHVAFCEALAPIRHELSLLRYDLALLAAEMSSDDAEISDLDLQKLPRLGIQDREGSAQRLPLKIQVHSIPPLLSSSPLLSTMANSPVQPPHSNDFVSATIPLRNVEKTRPVVM
ncbi:hypothetical protein DVH24_037945 [Malus domestica]|uniref:Uncharacterized protein n=1 Tax=Malus domestica TaxID=3750 RepID=A0A498JZ75_MALDO|nr:hypothetical protein DVH24_037945 [Malus domestica]